MLNGLIRWAVVIVIGIATFIPEYGFAWLAARWFSFAPIPIAVLSLLWAVVLSLALPFSLKLFRNVSTAAILGICGIGIYLASQQWQLDLPWWAFVGVVCAFIALGWYKTATPLWRWANGIVAVQETEEHLHE